MGALAPLVLAAALLAVPSLADAGGHRLVALTFTTGDSSPAWVEGAVAAYLQRRGIEVAGRAGAQRLAVTVTVATTPFGSTHVSSALVSVSIEGARRSGSPAHFDGVGKASHVDILMGQHRALENALNRVWPALDAAITVPAAIEARAPARAAAKVAIEVRVHGDGCTDQQRRLSEALRTAAECDTVEVVAAVPGLCGFRVRTSLAAQQLATRLQAALPVDTIEVTPHAVRLAVRTAAASSGGVTR